MSADQKITPCLWFDFTAEAAVEHYLGIFPESKIHRILRYGAATPQLDGRVLMIEFELAGRRFQALNGGPNFPFTEAISLSVDCVDQAEVDHYWQRLADGGSTGVCGWLKDKYGVSWQIVPRALPRLLADPDPVKAARAMQAMMRMTKIDVAQVQRAYEEEPRT
jgi:predicted 3-demethylubiquinone-9 3-methyltransferase (glyoxalase superfamily)